MDRELVRDRLKGMFVGVFLGDALGAPHELRSNTNNVYTGWMEVKSRRYNRFTKEETFYPVGMTTDDTEMTLALLHTVLSQGRYTNYVALDSYLHWASTGCDSMGTNTRAMLHGVKGKALGRKGYNNRVEKYLKGENPSQGNGTLMRAAPLVLVKNCEEAARKDASITNPNKVNEEAGFVYQRVLLSSLLDKRLGLDKETVDALPPPVREALLGYKRERDVSGKDKGWVCHALYLAIRAYFFDIKIEDPFSTFVDSIIKLGGDTDTNAAISCAVMGARLGFDAMMKEERTSFNYDAIMKSEWLGMRPIEYTVSDIDNMVDYATDLFIREHEV